MIITQQILNNGLSDNGAFNGAQLRELGIDTRYNTGWKKSLLGREYPDYVIERFLALKNVHLKHKTKDCTPSLF